MNRLMDIQCNVSIAARRHLGDCHATLMKCVDIFVILQEMEQKHVDLT